jgi:hypothetical protein
MAVTISEIHAAVNNLFFEIELSMILFYFFRLFKILISFKKEEKHTHSRLIED